jgi:hypothetical protein
MMISTVFAFTLLLVAACSILAAVPQGVNMASINDWDIVVDKDAIPGERHAAEEFQTFVARAGGVKLPIVEGVDRPDRHVFIGWSEIMLKSNVGFAVDGFDDEDLRIVIRDNNIAIAGGRPRGTLYGVYQFLEDYLGVRFLTTDHTYVPKVGEWRIVGPVDRFYHPPFKFRWCWYKEINSAPPFATRMRNNAVTDDPKFGGKTSMPLITHSFRHQLKTEDYGKEHPEYYSEVDGVRIAATDQTTNHSQPCLTNPDVYRIVVDKILAQLEADPTIKYVSISQNDNQVYCQCKDCAAIDKREESCMGTLLTFINKAATEISKKYPDVNVGTLSYQYTRKPTKHLRPLPNVQVQLCSIECCMIHPINDPNCPKNVRFCHDLAEWSEICNNISIWNYDTNFPNYHLPCPNLRSIEANIRYFVANNVNGVFMETAYDTLAAEMADLRNYMIGNLMWDPNKSGEKLFNEFIDLHYGKAGEPIRRYLNFLHDNAEAKGIHRYCFGKAADYGVDEKVTQVAMDSFDEAMKLAENDEMRNRVEKASMCAYRAAIEPVFLAEKPEDLSPETKKKLQPMVDRFFALCKKYKVTRIREWFDIEPDIEKLREQSGMKIDW